MVSVLFCLAYYYALLDLHVRAAAQSSLSLSDQREILRFHNCLRSGVDDPLHLATNMEAMVS